MPKNTMYYVDGPHFVYAMDNRIEYCVFSAKSQQLTEDEFIDQRSFHKYDNLHNDLFDIGKNSNIHQQTDQTILALAVLEENTSNMASAWLNHLQSKNPVLENASILIRIIEKEKSLELRTENHNR